MTIIIICNNNPTEIVLSLESIRNFNKFDDVSVIVADNGSKQAAFENGCIPSDITYAYFDEGKQPFGKLVNTLVKELSIEDDLLIMGSPYCICENTITNMYSALNADSQIGVVGGMSPSFGSYQKLPVHFASFTEFYEYEQQVTSKPPIKVLSTDSPVVLVTHTAYTKLNGFDNNLLTIDAALKDFCLRCLDNNLKSIVCTNSLFWNVEERYHRYFTSVEDINSDNFVLESKWGTHYFNTCGNINLINLISHNPDDCFSVLEIGCDCGATLLEIKNRFPQCTLYGTDISAPAVEIANHFICAKVNNIEDFNIPFETSFDYIIFGDVLEHLRCPDKVVKYCKTRLNPGGRIIASIPNLMHISVIENLLNGDFTYTETGLLDKTHIHFFTYKEIYRLFHAAGFNVDNITCTTTTISDNQNHLIEALLALGKGSERYMYEAFQYLVVCSVK